MERQSGFTLLELVITVAILAILAAIALPLYQQYVIDSRRAEAQSCLLQLGHSMERAYTERYDYRHDMDGSGAGASDGDDLSGVPLTCIDVLDGDYQFVIASVGNDTFGLEARPQGRQQARPAGVDRRDCGDLSLNERGERGADGNVADCW